MAATDNLEGPDPDRSDTIADLRVVITGGTSGLGLALVHELVARGARVAFELRIALVRVEVGDRAKEHALARAGFAFDRDAFAGGDAQVDGAHVQALEAKELEHGLRC